MSDTFQPVGRIAEFTPGQGRKVTVDGRHVAVFRLGIALAVLPFGWLAPLAGPPGGPKRRLPFPLHIQALLGTLWVVWLFRLVGLWWLVAALVHLSRGLT